MIFLLLSGFLLLDVARSPLFAAEQIHHDISLRLTPESEHLQAMDRMTLPPDLAPDAEGRYPFLLHAALIPEAVTPGVTIEEDLGYAAPSSGLEPEPETGAVPLKRYLVSLPVGLRVFVLQYEGRVFHPLNRGEYKQASQDTPGIITGAGIFLRGRSYWYPQFNRRPLSFRLDLILPPAWEGLSQGERSIVHGVDGQRFVRWSSPNPQEEIVLVAGEWTAYQRETGLVKARVYLQSPNAALAKRYLDATDQYLAMYQKLLGPYPFKKFAVVENFWSTSYGYPSFVMMAPELMQQDAPLRQDFPRLMLESWFGGAVFVDPSGGNWSEGLRAYLAEHLFEEGRSEATVLRLAALNNYSTLIRKATNDFPLRSFVEANTPSKEAVVRGKSMLLFHMIRKKLGDERFLFALKQFFRDYRFKMASFGDLEAVFSSMIVAEDEVAPDFMQWVTRAGAPILRAKSVRSERANVGYQLSAVFEQRQWGPPYQLEIPIAITLQGRKAAYETTLFMDEKTMTVDLALPTRPIRLKIDPKYELFRRLYRAEMPPALAQSFEAESTLILLPSTATTKRQRDYRRFAELLQMKKPDSIEIAWDKDFDRLPSDRAIWLLGWENRFQQVVLTQLRPFGLSTNSAMTRIRDSQLPRRNHILLLASRHPKNIKMPLTWLATDDGRKLPALIKKLENYPDSGYLGFDNKSLRTVLQGQWPAVGSPMSIRIRQADGKWIKEKKSSLSVSKALSRPAPLFSKQRLDQDIRTLSRPRLKGRGFGTRELDLAAEYIASEFRNIGLQPAGATGRSFLQQWRDKTGGVGSAIGLKNVMALLPAEPGALSEEILVLGAHYDHLGFGWPHVAAGDEGRLHPGANDNASGVALLLELARLLKAGKKLNRSILFVAFTGKELDFRGSRHFIETAKTKPRGKIVGMINLDSVGHLSENKLVVLGTASSRDWIPTLRQASVDTGVPILLYPDDPGESDHLSFIENNIPAIQLYSGKSPHSGRPGDTADRINLGGIVSAGRIARTLIETLSQQRPLQPKSNPAEAPALIWERR